MQIIFRVTYQCKLCVWILNAPLIRNLVYKLNRKKSVVYNINQACQISHVILHLKKIPRLIVKFLVEYLMLTFNLFSYVLTLAYWLLHYLKCFRAWTQAWETYEPEQKQIERRRGAGEGGRERERENERWKTGKLSKWNTPA